MIHIPFSTFVDYNMHGASNISTERYLRVRSCVTQDTDVTIIMLVTVYGTAGVRFRLSRDFVSSKTSSFCGSGLRCSIQK